jgi:hypothetical protein
VRVLVSTLVAIFAVILSTPPVGPCSTETPQAEVPTRVSQARPAQITNPVIVELFTSEGCSDCPPADQLLYRLAQTQPVPGAQIIALEQHVDYWDYEGWRDPFSSSQFTRRQKDYVHAFNLPSAYTPEMVVDGTTEFVGSDSHRALGAIERAARTPKANLQIARRQDAASSLQTAHLHVSFPALSGWNPKHGADVLIAITEDDLASNVTRGENAGSRLNHRAVVRELRLLGRVNSSMTFSADPDLNLDQNWKPEDLHVVVFAQDRSTRQVLGASMISLFETAK